jgi:hypothetical protein
MNTQSIARKLLSVIFILLVSIFLTACGGDPVDSDRGISYTGLTNMAIIDADNAVELSIGAYFRGPFKDNYWAEQLFEDQPPPLSQSPIIVSDTVTMIGECGGSLTTTVNIDNTNGDFTGTELFDSYCEDAMTTLGTVNLTGSVDLNTIGINNIAMSFELLTVSSVEGSVSMSGKINNQFGLGSLIQTMDYLIRDNDSNKVYEIDNYQVFTEILPTGTVEITFITGKYYHPDFGYVELESSTPFIVYDGGYGADSGELLVKGHALTKALLSVINSEEIEVKADTTGDDVYDFTWSSLD